jgi:Adenylate and Guanylate cyclase catalytic domain
MSNLLPDDSTGVLAIFDSPCSHSFTYEIRGSNAIYLGIGDQHDENFAYLGEHQTLRTNSSIPLNDEYCPVTLHLYPSLAMKDRYTTNYPIIFTFAVILIFVATSLVFILYDYHVERRQKRVLSSATKSSAIVSSLFPSQVRDQLYAADSVPESGARNSRQSIRDMMQPLDGDKTLSRRTGKISGSPIAELYPETTVFFADISGFTAWSSVRQPTQVFHLLETVYGAFDRIAERRRVFKVETIGDSYVAVVGLPTPRKHHAVVMVKFANDCRREMNRLANELETSLGPVSISW